MRRIDVLRLWLGLGLLLAGCARSLPPVEVGAAGAPPSYLEEVKPILDRRCVVCHSCYNAPCQLKLVAYEGVARGGSKDRVYASSRLVHQRPTRLFVDADSVEGWRRLGFHSVTESRATGSANDSILLQLLAAKRRLPRHAGEFHAESDDLACAANPTELSAFLREHPERGMPFGFPPLDDAEYATLSRWLQHGAPGPSAREQRALVTPSPAVSAQITAWEGFLNRADDKHALTARYLYEHYFLAHLSFSGAAPGEFFELVRSKTPPGEPIDVIATLRPYDDPGDAPVYFRFRKIHATIVHKTHMVVELDDALLARLREMFIDTPWLEPPHREPLGVRAGANPFLVYAQIPPRVRYRFLLDNAEYLIRTFIRGPVCKGQVALNVIHDHFWVMFRDPAADQTVLHPGFLVEQADNLRLPTEEGSQEQLIQTFSDRYRERYVRFYRAKRELYARLVPEGPDLEAIWRGERATDAPLLTVYRHFDSASVHKGALGDLPRTLWVIDYSQFERIYYALVAGFDVFGNVSHQVNVRRYMDLLRAEGELNFLEFLPVERRLPTLRSWYLGDRAIDNVAYREVMPERPTRVAYATDDPKRELVERVVEEHLRKDAGIVLDPINYTRKGVETAMPKVFETREDLLDGLRALTAPGTGFISHFTGSDVNLALVRVRLHPGDDRLFSIVVNRWHDNVNTLFGEEHRLDPSKDTLDFLPGSIGSYPNYFFDVDAEDLPDFFDLVANFDGSDRYLAKARSYGVNRADPVFWEAYDWFQGQLFEQDPLRAGLYDLNRYYHRALDSRRSPSASGQAGANGGRPSIQRPRRR